MVNFEVGLAVVIFEMLKKAFPDDASAAAAAQAVAQADIDDSIKRKCFRISLKISRMAALE